MSGRGEELTAAPRLGIHTPVLPLVTELDAPSQGQDDLHPGCLVSALGVEVTEDRQTATASSQSELLRSSQASPSPSRGRTVRLTAGRPARMRTGLGERALLGRWGDSVG